MIVLKLDKRHAYFLIGLAVSAVAWYVADLHAQIESLEFVLDNMGGLGL